MSFFRQFDQVKLFSQRDFTLIYSKNSDFSIPEIWSVLVVMKKGLILSCQDAIIFAKYDNVFKIKGSNPPIKGGHNG
jgi:hypothetical protein